jgi:hypothetical protein
MLQRLLIGLAVTAVAAAAPARAWCEATCLAPATASTSHCPTAEPAGDTATISTTSIDDCPILESAPPTIQARLDLHAVVTGTCAPALNAPSQLTPSFVRPHSATTVFERCTPLRI